MYSSASMLLFSFVRQLCAGTTQACSTSLSAKVSVTKITQTWTYVLSAGYKEVQTRKAKYTANQYTCAEINRYATKMKIMNVQSVVSPLSMYAS